MSGPNTPYDAKHEDMLELGNMTEDMPEADAVERPHSTFRINQLPREIIAEIFCNCLHESRETIWVSTSNAPLLLCRVCSSWRALAQATPELWSSIGIGPHQINRICVRIINTWLERSGTLPLTVTIDFVKIDYRDLRPGHKPTVVAAILSVICSYSSRWQNVAIKTWLPVLLPQLETLPLLRAFQIRVFGDPEQSAISLPFSGSPRLTRLVWPYLLDIPRDPRIPWSQISLLKLARETTFFAALEAIRLCPQLEEFTTNLTAENHGDRLPTTVENHCLRMLDIGINGVDYTPFFDSLILPELRDFRLFSQSTSGSASGRSAFLDLLTRSNCKLSRLLLDNCAFGPLIECLEHQSFKTIEELEIGNDPRITDNELIRLTDFPSPAGPPVLLPKLSQLMLHCCIYASRDTLVEMVLSRWRQRDGRKTEPLRFLIINNEEFYNEDVGPIKAAEVRDGFKAAVYMNFIINENGELVYL